MGKAEREQGRKKGRDPVEQMTVFDQLAVQRYQFDSRGIARDDRTLPRMIRDAILDRYTVVVIDSAANRPVRMLKSERLMMQNGVCVGSTGPQFATMLGLRVHELLSGVVRDLL